MSLPSPGEVTLWIINLDGEEGDPAPLDDAERARAQAMGTEQLRQRYVAAHAALRRILSRAAGLPPARLRMAVGERGKPHLPDVPEVEFNLSHAGPVAVVAVSGLHPVGVDIETPRKLDNLDALARRYLAAEELDALLALSEARRADAFLHYWTAKEAFIKGTGEGLHRPLDSFAVLPSPDWRAWRVQEKQGQDLRDGLWRGVTFSLSSGALLSLALPLDGFHASLRRYPDGAAIPISAPAL